VTEETQTAPTEVTVNTTPDEEFVPFFRQREFVDFLAPQLVENYQQRVYALMEEMESRLPFVGLKHFKQSVLAHALAVNAGSIFAELIIDRMIKNGDLQVEKIKTAYSEYETSTLKRAK